MATIVWMTFLPACPKRLLMGGNSPVAEADIARFETFFDSPALKTLGGSLLALDPEAGTSRIAFQPGPEFCNPLGQVQGGFITAMLDAAAGIAAIAKSGFTHFVPTLDIRTSFILPTGTAPIVAEGRCLRLGRTIGFLEGDLFDETGLLLARASITCRPVSIEKIRG